MCIWTACLAAAVLPAKLPLPSPVLTPAAAAAFFLLLLQDLEYLISKAVNTKNADYAVVTGVQIHNWASDLDDPRIPSMEFVAPARAYVVVNGEKIDLDLQQVRGSGCLAGWLALALAASYCYCSSAWCLGDAMAVHAAKELQCLAGACCGNWLCKQLPSLIALASRLFPSCP
jgi:hypothetical protein